MKRTMLGFLAAAVLSAGALVGIGQIRTDKKGGDRQFTKMRHGGHHGMGMNLRGLDLTEDQNAKVKAIFDANRETMKSTMGEMKAIRQRLADVNKDNFDEGATRQIANEQAALMAKMIVERERVKSQVWAILTPEQKAKAAEMRTMKHDRKRMHRGDKQMETQDQ